jgi:hypothetical protein
LFAVALRAKLYPFGSFPGGEQSEETNGKGNGSCPPTVHPKGFTLPLWGKTEGGVRCPFGSLLSPEGKTEGKALAPSFTPQRGYGFAKQRGNV